MICWAQCNTESIYTESFHKIVYNMILKVIFNLKNTWHNNTFEIQRGAVVLVITEMIFSVLGVHDF